MIALKRLRGSRAAQRFFTEGHCNVELDVRLPDHGSTLESQVIRPGSAIASYAVFHRSSGYIVSEACEPEVLRASKVFESEGEGRRFCGWRLSTHNTYVYLDYKEPGSKLTRAGAEGGVTDRDRKGDDAVGEVPCSEEDQAEMGDGEHATSAIACV